MLVTHNPPTRSMTGMDPAPAEFQPTPNDPFDAEPDTWRASKQATLTILRTKMNNTKSRRKKKRYQRECDEIERRPANDPQPSDPSQPDPFEDWAGNTPVDKRDPFGAGPDPFDDWADNTPVDKHDPFG